MNRRPKITSKNFPGVLAMMALAYRSKETDKGIAWGYILPVLEEMGLSVTQFLRVVEAGER